MISYSAIELNAFKLARSRAARWPFPLREFMEFTAVDTPAAAAQKAVTNLLANYFTKYPEATDLISVTRLCDLVGIEIRGRLPRISTKQARQSDLLESNTHSAKLTFDNGRPVIEVMDSRAPLARVSAGHELGHYLIHLRNGYISLDTLRASSSPEEEALSEYIGRLLLMPCPHFNMYLRPSANYSIECLSTASRAHVIMLSSAARMMDPDHLQSPIKGIILWKLHPNKPSDLPVAERLTPFWHQCADAFVPIRKCHAKQGSLVASLAALGEDRSSVSEEDVQVGSLVGRFRVDAYSWGSLRAGTRCVLSVFVKV
jgi:hypothetical protein